MWWDHYIYCNFWAHAVVHRVHHTPTRRLESQSARFIWLIWPAIFLSRLCGLPAVGLSNLYTWTGSGLQTPRPSRARMRAHARAAPRLTGVRRTRSREPECGEKREKNSPLLSPRPNTESWCRINEAVWHDSVPFGLTVWIKLSPLSSHKCTQGIAYYSNCGPYGGHATPHSRLS